MHTFMWLCLCGYIITDILYTHTQNEREREVSAFSK